MQKSELQLDGWS